MAGVAPDAPRYPLADLVAATGLTEAALARDIGLSGTTLKNARENGFSASSADRYAVRAGLHPFEVWPEMVGYETERVIISDRAKKAAAQRRWRTKNKDYVRNKNYVYYQDCSAAIRAQRRASYWADAEAARAERRARYERNRQAEIERQRAYRARLRAQNPQPTDATVAA